MKDKKTSKSRVKARKVHRSSVPSPTEVREATEKVIEQYGNALRRLGKE